MRCKACNKKLGVTEGLEDAYCNKCKNESKSVIPDIEYQHKEITDVVLDNIPTSEIGSGNYYFEWYE